MKIRIVITTCIVLAILCFFLISNNLALNNDKFVTPYELSIDLLEKLKDCKQNDLNKVYENTFNDGREKKEFTNEIFSFALAL